MFNKLKQLFKKKPTQRKVPKITGRILLAKIHSTWGDEISFEEANEETKMIGINGHSPYHYKVGDVIVQRCESGKLGRFIIVEIRYMDDPTDQFFGTVGCIDYVDDSILEDDVPEVGPWIDRSPRFLS